jgi:tetratricopeptide (TPR) repeat protein
MSSALAFASALVLSLLACPSAICQSPPSPANAPDLSQYTAEPYVLEYIHRTYRFEADGKSQRESKVRMSVQSESAVREFGLLVYPYMSSFENLDILYVRVRKPDGTVVDTPSDDIQELDSAVSRAAPMYTDQREKHVAVKSLAVGDVLETDVRWTMHDPIAPGHFWFDDEFFTKGICFEEVTEFNVPATVSVKFAASDPPPQIKGEGGRRIYTFHNSHLEKEEHGKDDTIPSWEKDFHGFAPPPIRLTSFSSWADIGAWYANVQQSRAQVTPRIRSTAEEITKGKTTEDEKIHALYDYVSSRYRYIGIDLGLSRYTPHAAEDVLANRYGDCKDKHTLFAALLEAIGVHAYPVLVSTKFKIDPDFPSPSLFDHVITAIPRGDSYVFIDTTPEVAPFGLLMAGIRDRQVLVIPRDAPAKLLTTPPNPPFRNREVFHMDASIDAKGTLDGKAHIEERGDPEVFIRLAYRNTPQNQWKELTQQIMAGMGFGGSVSEVVAAPPEKTADAFSLSFDYHRTDYSDWKENRIGLPIPPMGLPELNDTQKKSKDPLPLGSPQDVLYESSIKFPQGIVPGVPPNVEEKNDFAEYSADYRVENGTFFAARHLVIKQREIPGAQRSSYSAFVKAMREDAEKWVFLIGNTQERSPFQQAHELLQENKVADAVKLLEKATADEPENQPLSVALGEAYLRLPDESKAVSQFQKVVSGKPTSSALNSIAYSYATANLRLSDALDYATRAVAETSADTMKASPDSSNVEDFIRMASLAAHWDTLGWVKFRSGDAVSAEKYIRAAWMLWQRAVIGEHLAEIYRKLGKNAEADHIAYLALQAPGMNDEPDVRAKLEAAQKGSAPSRKTTTDSNRPTLHAPAGLSDLRSIKVPRNFAMTAGSKIALFAIALDNGSSSAKVRFVSGDKELQPEIKTLASVHYDQPFPDATPARVLRAGYLSCSKYLPTCTWISFLVDDRQSLKMVKPSTD